MAAPLSKVNFAAFEQALTSDLNRVQSLSSRELQDIMRYWCANDAEVNATTGDNDQLGASGQVPIIGADRLPSISSSTTTFQQTVGAGQAYKNTATGVGVDDSSYQVYRWPATTVTHSTPNGANPRIDLIVVSLGTTQTDGVLRNILVDPVNRTVAQQTINKTQNPLGTVSIVNGTAAANPSAPYASVHADSIVLFEVWVPPAVANASLFGVTRQLHKRAAYPVSSMTGVISGMQLDWDEGFDEASDNNLPILMAEGDLINNVHRVVIGGQVLTYHDSVAYCTGLATSYNDVLQNPFGTSAPSNNDRPFYIYACGGSGAPVGQPFPDRPAAPFVLVRSLTPPGLNGHATAALQITRQYNGANQTIPRYATCYIGMGFSIKNTTRSKACWTEGDWIYAATATNGQLAGFEFKAVVNTGAATDFQFDSKPPISNAIQAAFRVRAPGTWVQLPLTYDVYYPGLGNKSLIEKINWNWVSSAADGASPWSRFGLRAEQGPPEPHFTAELKSTASVGSLTLQAVPTAYKMNVPRLGGGF